MSEQRTFILVSEAVRGNCLVAVRMAPLNYVVRIEPHKRSLEQSAKMWAMIHDIARSKPEGRNWVAETWKAAFMHFLGHQVMFAEGLDGTGPFPIGFRTSKLTTKQMADLLTCIQEYGDRHQVKWTPYAGGYRE